jgi:hypothetical protein
MDIEIPTDRPSELRTGPFGHSYRVSSRTVVTELAFASYMDATTEMVTATCGRTVSPTCTAGEAVASTIDEWKLLAFDGSIRGWWAGVLHQHPLTPGELEATVALVQAAFDEQIDLGDMVD